MNNDRTVRLTVNAMLAALCACLGYISLDLGNLKITFESLPVLMAGLMFGPASGAAPSWVSSGAGATIPSAPDSGEP